MPSALVVGGTGPTGPHVVQGLLDRGFDVAIFHRGVHEPEELPEVEHIHGDPHFKETIQAALQDRSFDVTLAMYGRTRILAEELADRTEHFLSIGGAPVYAGFNEPTNTTPSGLPAPVREDDPLVDTLADDSPGVKFGKIMVETERTVFHFHPGGTHLRYPILYGPRNSKPWEWSVIKRVNDRRPYLILPNGGTALHSRCSPRNAAQFVLLAVDHREAAGGEVFNCAEDVQYSLRQWCEILIDLLEADIEIVGIPAEVAKEAAAAYASLASPLSEHALFDTSNAKARLGYKDVISTRDALVESIEWYARNPVDLDARPGYLDTFDYESEERLLTAWRSALQRLEEEAPQQVPEALHSMPHPKEPGMAKDHKGR